MSYLFRAHSSPSRRLQTHTTASYFPESCPSCPRVALPGLAYEHLLPPTAGKALISHAKADWSKIEAFAERQRLHEFSRKRAFRQELHIPDSAFIRRVDGYSGTRMEMSASYHAGRLFPDGCYPQIPLCGVGTQEVYDRSFGADPVRIIHKYYLGG